MIDPGQLRSLVVVPALTEIGMHSNAAVQLVMGTIAHESQMGRYIKQVGGGPALGICQMEPATYYDHWNWLVQNKPLSLKLHDVLGSGLASVAVPAATNMIWNLKFAVAMCRVHYYRVNKPLPQAGDLQGLANYYKVYYNSTLGKATPEDFIEAYKKYVEPLGED